MLVIQCLIGFLEPIVYFMMGLLQLFEKYTLNEFDSDNICRPTKCNRWVFSWTWSLNLRSWSWEDKVHGCAAGTPTYLFIIIIL